MAAKKQKFAPGDCVRYSTKFLRNTGQYTYDPGQRQKWTVIAHPGCSFCASGNFVALDEPSYDDPSRPTHVHVANITGCNRPDYYV